MFNLHVRKTEKTDKVKKKKMTKMTKSNKAQMTTTMQSNSITIVA